MAEPKSSAGKIFLLAAAVLGVLATVVAYTWLDRARSEDKVPTISVMAARRDLKPNQVIDPATDFVEVALPKRTSEKWATNCVLAAEAAFHKGSRVNRAVYAGQYIMKADLAGPAVDLDLRGDKRALTIQAKDEHGLGGNLVPGDYVKLLVKLPMFSAPSGRLPVNIDVDPTAALAAGTQPATPVVMTSDVKVVLEEPVRVLAVGQRLARNRINPTVGDQFERSSSQGTVTLEVTEQQAKQILSVSDGGNLPIWLMLCPAPEAATTQAARN